jgi:predicted SAM-dependent methyltransferase
MWRPEDPQGNESAKIKYELVRWTVGRGLDIGCGPFKTFPHFIGIDSLPYPGIAHLADAQHLEFFAPRSMDFIFSSHTLEHIEDTAATLAHWWELIKENGYLILYLPHKEFYPTIGKPGSNPDHKHDFQPSDIVKVMKKIAPDWDLRENQERNGGREYSFFQVFQKLSSGSGHKESWKVEPIKKAAVVRYGAFGDALWASSILPLLKKQGYHVTVYTQEAGATVLANDPHVDEIIVNADYQLPNQELFPYWIWEQPKYEKWVNLVGSVETRLLPQQADILFYAEDDLRRELMSKENYLETVHRFAGVPQEYHQKFYPLPDEVAWAKEERATYDGPVVVMNPAGSIKDRMAIHIIEKAEKAGLLRKGGTIVENTSGNTGVALAVAAAVKGYRCIFTMPDKMSKEKQDTLKAFGAQVIVTPTNVPAESPESYYSVARRIAAETPNSFYLNQYHNPDNIAHHFNQRTLLLRNVYHLEEAAECVHELGKPLLLFFHHVVLRARNILERINETQQFSVELQIFSKII